MHTVQCNANAQRKFVKKYVWLFVTLRCTLNPSIFGKQLFPYLRDRTKIGAVYPNLCIYLHINSHEGFCVKYVSSNIFKVFYLVYAMWCIKKYSLCWYFLAVVLGWWGIESCSHDETLKTMRWMDRKDFFRKYYFWLHTRYVFDSN